MLRPDAGGAQPRGRASCEMKAEIVARDEREQGDRALLNLGHTFGHALEAETGFSSAAAARRGGGARHAWPSTSPRASASSAEDAVRVRRHLATKACRPSSAHSDSPAPHRPPDRLYEQG